MIMEHNPLVSFKDGLEITYSDLKVENDKEYIVLYFEKPNDKLSGFDSAKFVYPGEEFSEVQGFSKADLDELMVHVKKTAPLALRFSKEDAGATV
ncbi:MAG: hypothetical protein E7296_06440 [Lachnospiraceae bacterium]|jgi:hypothetical protein|nr:hypothetical protein [Lachnospiraceae bacterium]